MKFKVRRLFFIAIVAFVILTDCGFALLSYRRSYDKDATRAAVVQSYGILDRIAGISLALHNYLFAKTSANRLAGVHSVDSMREHYLILKGLVDGDAAHAVNMQNISFLGSENTGDIQRRIDFGLSRLSAALSDMRASEMQRLKASHEADAGASGFVRYRVLVSLSINCLLMGLLIVLWTSTDKLRRVSESTLTSAIETSERTTADLKVILQKRAKDLHSTVHDLKNPLGAIKGFTDLIEEDRFDPHSVSEMSRTLRRLSDHTLTLVNDLLESESQSSAVCVVSRSVNIVSYIEDVQLALRPQLAKKNQRLCIQAGVSNCEVHGDPKKIWDVFMNVMGNSSKFSPPNSKIDVRIKANHNRVQIRVEDEGPGFSEDDLQNLFIPFKKLSAQPTGGEISTGLGLGIVKSVVESCGGSIGIANRQEGRGAIVTIEFPTVEKIRLQKS